MQTEEYAYDSNGNCVKVITSFSEVVNTYDKSNRLIKSESDLGWVEEYKYNEHGDCIEVLTIYSDGSSGTDEFSYEYDSNGNIIEKNEIGGTDYHYEYDKNSNCIKEYQYLFTSKNDCKEIEYLNYKYFYKD